MQVCYNCQSIIRDDYCYSCGLNVGPASPKDIAYAEWVEAIKEGTAIHEARRQDGLKNGERFKEWNSQVYSNLAAIEAKREKNLCLIDGVVMTPPSVSTGLKKPKQPNTKEKTLIMKKINLSRVIRARRESLKMSKADLARALNTSRSNVTRWEAGTVPNGNDLLAIFDALKIAFLPRKDSQKKPKAVRPVDLHTIKEE